MSKRAKSKAGLKKAFHFFVDLIEDHPFEIGLSFALVAFGIRIATAGLEASPGSVQSLPTALAVIYVVLAVIGGGAVLFGLGARYKFFWAYGVEQFGLWLSASAWASYVVGLIATPITARSTLLIFGLLALVLGCLLRIRAVRRRSSAVHAALQRAKENVTREG